MSEKELGRQVVDDTRANALRTVEDATRVNAEARRLDPKTYNIDREVVARSMAVYGD